MVKLYNFLSRKKQVFRPLRRSRAGLYTCGPTVYDYAHIGNLRTYVFEDVLRRTLEYAGYRVRHVMNVTDVGHLTSDADEGEDKLEAGARAKKKTVWEIAEYYTEAFLKDIAELNIKRAHVLAPATRNIPAQIKLVRTLFARGYAYETPQAVYYDVAKFKRYAKLSRQPLERQLVGARGDVVVDPAKRHPQDFALWFKTVGRFAHHVMRWPSPWGEGFPGWHIECSAISMKHLGDTLDVHTGGVDHIATHHTNEIAQSEAATGKPFARFFVEGEHLLVDGRKMAKSAGNFYTLREVTARGFDPFAFRYLALASHYRSTLNFTWESLGAAQHALRQLQDVVQMLVSERGRRKRGAPTRYQKFRAAFDRAIFDDLNTPQALSVVWELIRDYHKKPTAFDPKGLLQLLYDFDRVLGLKLRAVKRIIVPKAIRELVEKREALRKVRDWKAADRLRRNIEVQGWNVNDTPEGVVVRPT